MLRSMQPKVPYEGCLVSLGIFLWTEVGRRAVEAPTSYGYGAVCILTSGKPRAPQETATVADCSSERHLESVEGLLRTFGGIPLAEPAARTASGVSRPAGRTAR